MTKFPRTIAQLRAHPAVEEVEDDRVNDNGWWVHLADGWWSPATETHSIHEDSIRECLREFRDIERCTRTCCGGPDPAY